MPITRDSLRQAIKRYKQKNRDRLRPRQATYSRKHYTTHRDAVVARMRVKREFLRLARAMDSFEWVLNK